MRSTAETWASTVLTLTLSAGVWICPHITPMQPRSFASWATCCSKLEIWFTASLTRALIALLSDQYSMPRQARQAL